MRQLIAGVILCGSVCAPGPVAAQSAAPRVFDGAPAAPWIFSPGAGGTDFGVFDFRRVFELNATPSNFVVHVSADNRYRLFVNGQQVSSGPQRSDLMHWRYETVDVAPQLRAGRNVIAAFVLYLICCLAVLPLRARNVATAGAPFRAPGGTFVPLIASAIIVWLLSTLSWAELVAAMSLVAVSGVAYTLQERWRRARIGSINRLPSPAVLPGFE
jgi:hypothetical protein